MKYDQRNMQSVAKKVERQKYITSRPAFKSGTARAFYGDMFRRH